MPLLESQQFCGSVRRLPSRRRLNYVVCSELLCLLQLCCINISGNHPYRREHPEQLYCHVAQSAKTQHHNSHIGREVRKSPFDGVIRGERRIGEGSHINRGQVAKRYRESSGAENASEHTEFAQPVPDSLTVAA